MIPHRLTGRFRRARRRLGSLLLGLAITAAPVGGMHALAAPSPPAIVQAQGLSDNTVELIWTAVTGAETYTVLRGGIPLTTTTGTLYDDASGTASTTYNYQVVANAGGTSSTPTSASATTQAPLDTQAPTIPGSITPSSLSSLSVKLSWGKSTDNQGVEGYRILRSPAGDTSPLLDIWTTDDVASYTAKALQAGTAYTFGVQAIDTEDNASTVRTISITTQADSDTTAPSKPSYLTLRVFSSSRIDLDWSVSSSSDVSGYQILRGGSIVGRIDLPARPQFSDNGLTAQTAYSYQVKAIDSAGNVSETSPTRTATTLSAGTPIVARGPYLQSVSGTSARVVWWTNISTQSVVQYGAGALTASVTDPTPTLQHVMLIGPLSPGMLYSYTVGDGTFATASASFGTAPAPGTQFTFAALGDFGGNAPGETQNGNLIAGDASQFMLTLGDSIYPEAADPNFATTYSDYDGRLFKQFGTAMKSKPFWAVNGNHEYFGHRAWWQHMSLPNNERWYSYDWGDAHILILDSEMPYTPGTPQYQFAEADLASHQSAAWRIVALHRPPYSSSSSSSASTVGTYLVPLLQQQNVQLVLAGHSHNYERTYPLIDGVPTAGGVTYIVSGNGGNGFNTFSATQPSWSAYRQSDYYGYLRITLNSSSLTVNEIRSDTGTIIDSTTIGGSADITPPSAPSNVQATAISANRVDLQWTASTDNVGVTEYDISREGTPLATVAGTTTAYSDTTVLPSTTYDYTVTAKDEAGSESPASNMASVTTPAPEPTLTFSPTDDTYIQTLVPDATAGSVASIQVDGSPLKHILLKFNLTGLAGRQVIGAKLRLYDTDPSPKGGDFYKTVSDIWSEATATWNNAPATMGSPIASLGSVAKNTWYEVDLSSIVSGDGIVSLRVISTDSNGANYTSNNGAVGFRPQLVVSYSGSTPTPPAAPSGLTAASNGGDGPVALSWTAPSGTVDSYTVKRGATPGGPYTTTVPGSGTSATDTTVASGQTYYYVVTATSAGGESGNSNEASVTLRPAAPTSLTATAGDGQVTLNWTAAYGATSYTVKRSTTAGGPYADTGSPTPATSTTDSSLANGTTYYYVVTATNAGGQSGASNEATGTPSAQTRTFAFSDGFETGDLSMWTTKGGLIVQTSLKHSGTWAAQGTTTDGRTYAKKLLSTTYTEGYFRSYVYLAAGYTSQVNLLRYRTATDASLGSLFVTTAGRLAVQNDVGVITTTSTRALTSGSWHSLELRLVVNGTSSSTEVWLDGFRIDDLSLSNQNWGTTPIGKIQIGEVQSGRTYDVAFDDVAFDSQLVGP